MQHKDFLIRNDHARFPTGRNRLRAASTVAVGLLLVMAAGCTASDTAASSASAASSAAGPAPAAGAAAAGSSAAASAAPAAGAGAAAAGTGAASTSRGRQSVPSGIPQNVGAVIEATDRQVIKTANVTMDVTITSTNKGAAADLAKEQEAVNSAYVEVAALPSGDGYVSAVDGGGTTVSITLRVPVAAFGSVMGTLSGIAPIASRQISTQDVTANVADIGSRVQTMKASVAQGRLLLSKAVKIGDVIAIESEVNEREADLESLESQQAALAGQTALSTITVVLRGSVTGVKSAVAPPKPVPPAARSGFFGGLANGWAAVRHIGHAVLTVIGTLIPFLPIFAVIALGFVYWHRRTRRSAVPVLATQPGDPRPSE